MKTIHAFLGVLVFGAAWEFIIPANNIRTATRKGTGTGMIEYHEGTFVTVSASASPNHIVTLPDPVIGVQLIVHAAKDPFKLCASVPEFTSINGGKGPNAGTKIEGGTTVFLTCVSDTQWVASGIDAHGDSVWVAPAR